MNAVTLVGRLTRDPVLSAAGERQVCEFRVAVPRTAGSSDADFVDVACFGAVARTCAEHLTRGRLVGVSGRLRYSEWEAEQGRRSKTDVVADAVDFLDRRSQPDGDAAGDGGRGWGERGDRPRGRRP